MTESFLEKYNREIKSRQRFIEETLEFRASYIEHILKYFTLPLQLVTNTQMFSLEYTLEFTLNSFNYIASHISGNHLVN